MAKVEEYEVLEKIGHGSFGIIRKVRRKSDGLIMCRKEINYLRAAVKEREQIEAEFKILASLAHDNIVGYYHRQDLKESHEVHIYMEYCGNGDLQQIIRDLKAKDQFADERFVWGIFGQLVTALYRCHHDEKPPEVGENFLVPSYNAKPPAVGTKGRRMILHRDLKPENVFLGDRNSVKLGDFGLSKVMQPQDFTSTYVGTPFYMSPEVCAAERYGHYSDIWSLGCIMYELCAKEPPFNAKTHVGLIQKIKEGRVAPLPPQYSEELQQAIKSCLRVNPNNRPDTAQLINLPIVKMMRMDREMVDCREELKAREDAVRKKVRDAEEHIRIRVRDIEQRLVLERQQAYQELDAGLRREWEVKAQLEIDRQVQAKTHHLRSEFEALLEAKVEERVQAELNAKRAPLARKPLKSTLNQVENIPPSTSPPKSVKGLIKKTNQTPLHRSQTMFNMEVAPSPMDISMGEASPMSLASLSLSPRRGGDSRPSSLRRNIFAAAAAEKKTQAVGINLGLPTPPDSSSLQAELDRGWEEDENENDENHMPPPSPTRKPGPARQIPRPSLGRAATTGNVMKGRTLVELSQARAPPSSRRLPVPSTFPTAVWDLESDDLPSPFLKRTKNVFHKATA
ncbi:MAG: Mitochondrial pyruvate carrier 2 [Chaenotheca gracillima]|nr:MAG: Mitochondrial pyruvate carrier 2 [Chaenotheca gracillima]